MDFRDSRDDPPIQVPVEGEGSRRTATGQRRAASDLAEIADYTIAEFGIDQARRYRDQLDACFRSLLANPQLGRSAEKVAPGLRRIRQQAHVVFLTG